MDYRTKGVCSQSIHFDIEDNKIHNVSFVGGCNGNLQGISHLVEGMEMRPSHAWKESSVDSRKLPVRISLLRH